MEGERGRESWSKQKVTTGLARSAKPPVSQPCERHRGQTLNTSSEIPAQQRPPTRKGPGLQKTTWAAANGAA